MLTTELIDKLTTEQLQFMRRLVYQPQSELMSLHRHYCGSNTPEAKIYRFLIEREWDVRDANDKISRYTEK